MKRIFDSFVIVFLVSLLFYCSQASPDISQIKNEIQTVLDEQKNHGTREISGASWNTTGNQRILLFNPEPKDLMAARLFSPDMKRAIPERKWENWILRILKSEFNLKILPMCWADGSLYSKILPKRDYSP